jgi:hypothetical protein
MSSIVSVSLPECHVERIEKEDQWKYVTYLCADCFKNILIQQFYCRPHNDSMVTVEHFSLILYFLENTSYCYYIRLFARTTCTLILRNSAINCNIISLRRNLLIKISNPRNLFETFNS